VCSRQAVTAFAGVGFDGSIVDCAFRSGVNVLLGDDQDDLGTVGLAFLGDAVGRAGVIYVSEKVAVTTGV
jgi:hypothetical protein